MKKSLLLCGTAALGSLLLVACSEDSSSSAGLGENACLLNSTEEGVTITCGSEKIGIIKTSSDGVYGASCMAEALKDDSGYKLVCGGDSVGVVYNGEHGINGVPGTNGNPGTKGDDGASCDAKPAESGNGYDLYCGGVKKGTITNGSNGVGKAGTSCTAKATTNGYDLYCGDEKVSSISNGNDGDDGKSCSIEETEDGGVTLTCETDDGPVSYTVEGGAKGERGYGCTSQSYVGYTVITCQTGETTSKKDTILAAGYKKCGSGASLTIYNSLTDTCMGSTVEHYTCGTLTAILREDDFCENGTIYNGDDYWTAATTYPRALYGKCGDSYYLIATQWCDDGENIVDRYQLCGTSGKLYDLSTQTCTEDEIGNKDNN